MTYVAQHIASSVVQRRHGLDPLHFVFLMRHLSHALRTRLRIFTGGSCVDINIVRRTHGSGLDESGLLLLVIAHQSIERSRLDAGIWTVFYRAIMVHERPRQGTCDCAVAGAVITRHSQFSNDRLDVPTYQKANQQCSLSSSTNDIVAD
jgi:hypothetical protein